MEGSFGKCTGNDKVSGSGCRLGSCARGVWKQRKSDPAFLESRRMKYLENTIFSLLNWVGDSSCESGSPKFVQTLHTVTVSDTVSKGSKGC